MDFKALSVLAFCGALILGGITAVLTRLGIPEEAKNMAFFCWGVVFGAVILAVIFRIADRKTRRD